MDDDGSRQTPPTCSTLRGVELLLIASSDKCDMSWSWSERVTSMQQRVQICCRHWGVFWRMISILRPLVEGR